MRHLANITALIVLAALLSGCPGSSKSSGPVDHCTKTGQKCRIKKGELGVCMMDSAGKYQCAPQH